MFSCTLSARVWVRILYSNKVSSMLIVQTKNQANGEQKSWKQLCSHPGHIHMVYLTSQGTQSAYLLISPQNTEACVSLRHHHLVACIEITRKAVTQNSCYFNISIEDLWKLDFYFTTSTTRHILEYFESVRKKPGLSIKSQHSTVCWAHANYKGVDSQ